MAMLVGRAAPIEENGYSQNEEKQNPVFRFQKSHGSVLDALGDLGHAGRTLGGVIYFLGFPPSKEQSQNSKSRQDKWQI